MSLYFTGRHLSPTQVKKVFKKGGKLKDIIKGIKKKGVSINEQKLVEEKAVEILVTTKDMKGINSNTKQFELGEISLFFKQGENISVEVSQYYNKEIDKILYKTRVTIVSEEGEKINKRKLIFEDNKETREYLVPSQTTKLEFYAASFISDHIDYETGRVKTPLSNSDPNEFWGVPCFDIEPTFETECCQFRYWALPWNELITYNYCGAGCTKDWLNPVNDLDNCCRTHDYCYKNNGYNDCACDKAMLNCAEGTDNAGSSRVVHAFELKVALHFCN